MKCDADIQLDEENTFHSIVVDLVGAPPAERVRLEVVKGELGRRLDGFQLQALAEEQQQRMLARMPDSVGRSRELAVGPVA